MKCLFCFKETDKMYCNKRCADKYYYKTNDKYREKVKKASKEYYYKNKNNPKFKAKVKKRFKKWLNENKEHYNNLMREPNRLYQARMRAKADKEGMCKKCFKKKRIKGYVKCNKCLKLDRVIQREEYKEIKKNNPVRYRKIRYIQNEYNRKKRAEASKLGLCNVCWENKADEGVKCSECRKKARAFGRSIWRGKMKTTEEDNIRNAVEKAKKEFEEMINNEEDNIIEEIQENLSLEKISKMEGVLMLGQRLKEKIAELEK